MSVLVGFVIIYREGTNTEKVQSLLTFLRRLKLLYFLRTYFFLNKCFQNFKGRRIYVHVSIIKEVANFYTLSVSIYYLKRYWQTGSTPFFRILYYMDVVKIGILFFRPFYCKMTIKNSLICLTDFIIARWKTLLILTKLKLLLSVSPTVYFLKNHLQLWIYSGRILRS